MASQDEIALFEEVASGTLDLVANSLTVAAVDLTTELGGVLPLVGSIVKLVGTLGKYVYELHVRRKQRRDAIKMNLFKLFELCRSLSDTLLLFPSEEEVLFLLALFQDTKIIHLVKVKLYKPMEALKSLLNKHILLCYNARNKNKFAENCLSTTDSKILEGFERAQTLWSNRMVSFNCLLSVKHIKATVNLKEAVAKNMEELLLLHEDIKATVNLKEAVAKNMEELHLLHEDIRNLYNETIEIHQNNTQMPEPEIGGEGQLDANPLSDSDSDADSEVEKKEEEEEDDVSEKEETTKTEVVLKEIAKEKVGSWKKELKHLNVPKSTYMLSENDLEHIHKWRLNQCSKCTRRRYLCNVSKRSNVRLKSRLKSHTSNEGGEKERWDKFMTLEFSGTGKSERYFVRETAIADKKLNLIFMSKNYSTGFGQKVVSILKKLGDANQSSSETDKIKALKAVDSWIGWIQLSSTKVSLVDKSKKSLQELWDKVNKAQTFNAKSIQRRIYSLCLNNNLRRKCGAWDVFMMRSLVNNYIVAV